MGSIAYDASVEALLFPGRRATLLRAGVAAGPIALPAECARLAYYAFDHDPAERERLVADLALAGFGEVVTFAHGSTQAFGARAGDGRRAVLAFRGTQPTRLEDLAIDALATPLPWRGHGLVHQGFAMALEEVREGVEAWLREDCAGCELVFCGHSLGAALATLAASLWRPAALVTVASPRVGDATFAATLDGVPHTRLVNCADVVPRLPPAGLYTHGGELHFITHDGRLLRDPAIEQVEADRMMGRIDYEARHHGPGNAPTRDLADHAPINYLRALFP